MKNEKEKFLKTHKTSEQQEFILTVLLSTASVFYSLSRSVSSAKVGLSMSICCASDQVVLKVMLVMLSRISLST